MTTLQAQKRANSIRFFIIVSMLILFVTASFMIIFPVLSQTVATATDIPKTLNAKSE